VNAILFKKQEIWQVQIGYHRLDERVEIR